MPDVPIHPLITREIDRPRTTLTAIYPAGAPVLVREPLPKGPSGGPVQVFLVHHSWLVFCWYYGYDEIPDQKAILDAYEHEGGYPSPTIIFLGNVSCGLSWYRRRLQIFRIRMDPSFLREALQNYLPFEPPLPGRYDGAFVPLEPRSLHLWLKLRN